MPYFLSEKNLVSEQTVEITGEEARHILLAHRAKKGERIKLQGPDGKRHLAEIVSASKNSLSAKALEEIKTPAEPSVAITLLQAVVNEKALDFIFQKGTELGLGKIILFNSANTAKKISREDFEKKQSRWQKILIEAAKQCERAKWPALEFLPNLQDILPVMQAFDIVYLMDIAGEKPGNISSSAVAGLAVVVGPEGGFTDQEIDYFKKQSNLKSLSLGPILLRAETAALSSLAILNSAVS